MGGDTTVEAPQTPAAPTTAQNISDYVNGLPAMYQASLEYNPKYAQQNYDLAAQYSPQYAELLKTTNESLYPGLAKLNETLTQQAQGGMDAALPESMKAQYLNQMRSEIGGNAGSGIGSDYVSRGLVNAGEQYKNYYQNMALSLTGRQPLTNASVPTFQDAGAGYNYGQTSNNNMQGYGSYAGLYGNMYGANQQANSTSNQGMYGLIGSGISAGGVLGAGMMAKTATMMCVPENSQIELEDGTTIPVEDVKLGMMIKGGEVLKTSKGSTGGKDNFMFCEYETDGGPVVTSRDHPIYNKILDVKKSEIMTDFAYDILTTSGFYYINGIKLGSTIGVKHG